MALKFEVFTKCKNHQNQNSEPLDVFKRQISSFHSVVPMYVIREIYSHTFLAKIRETNVFTKKKFTKELI